MHDKDTNGLDRSLKNRHVQMIALGGVIGTGLFYGSSEAIQLAGPATLIAYVIGGFIIYLIMRMLGEMSAEEPVSGAFSYFAYKYWGGFAGFISGWNYWFLYILVSMTELTVIGIYLDHWFLLDHWVSSLIVIVIVTLINLANVRLYGEFEFWIALIKILAVIGMIGFGLFLIITGIGNPPAKISYLWDHGGFFPNGLTGIFFATAVIMFSFGGTELIGITAGEAANPQKTIPQAIRKVMWRVLIFYLGSIAVVMMMSPWNLIGTNQSPFVTIFENIGIPSAGNILNFVVIIAAISVYNSGIYSNGRMLYSLAEQKNAPAIFTKLSKNRVPYIAILFSSFCTCIIVFINYMIPNGAFMRIMAVATAAACITWAMIVLVHLRFRQAQKNRTKQFIYRSACYPYANYLCLVFLAMLFIIMIISGFTKDGLLAKICIGLGLHTNDTDAFIRSSIADMSLSAFIIPLWCLILYIGYKLKK